MSYGTMVCCVAAKKFYEIEDEVAFFHAGIHSSRNIGDIASKYRKYRRIQPKYRNFFFLSKIQEMCLKYRRIQEIQECFDAMHVFYAKKRRPCFTLFQLLCNFVEDMFSMPRKEDHALPYSSCILQTNWRDRMRGSTNQSLIYKRGTFPRFIFCEY